jgi:membrane-bound lytic murein transglycosylase D
MLPRLALVIATSVLVGCGAHVRPNALPSLPVQPLAEPVGTPVPLAPDRFAFVIMEAERAFEAGRTELQQNHLVAARAQFDRAIDLLLNEPTGARAEPRLRTAFERLLDRISALELIALREGDGFAEAESAPAAIDELLAAAMFERPSPAATTEETVAADLAYTPRDVPIPINDKVLSYVELFQGRLREFMQEGLDRGRPYLPMIRQVFQAEGLPLDLAYVPLVESAFKTNALSRASARGMWQFMLPTAREHGLEQNWFIDERSDPEKATRAAAQYLKSLYEMFDDWNLALASYNAGPGRISRAMRLSRQTDYWRVTASSRYLPRETREYVPMILAAIVIAKNPTLYGFDPVSTAPLTYETVTIPQALDLRIVAEWAAVPLEQVRELNPELRRTTTPAQPHELKVPIGTAATIQARLATADPSLFVKFDFHTVRRGETLAAIARRYGIRLADLRAANDMRTSRISVNQTLMIPTRPSGGLPSTTRASVPVVASSAGSPVTYRVQRGDTLFSIARRFDTTVDSIKRLNRLSTDRIIVGDRLMVRQ